MSSVDMDSQTTQRLEEAQQVAKQHYITLSAYERANPQIRVLSGLVAELGNVRQEEVTLRTVDTRSLNKEITTLIMGPSHGLDNLEQIEMLQAFAEAAAKQIRFAIVHTTNTAPHQAPAGATRHQASATPAAKPDPAKESKDLKLLTDELKKAVVDRGEHRSVIRLARRWEHLGAEAFYEALRDACGISAPAPGSGQTAHGYVAKLPLECKSYRQRTIAKQIGVYGDGRGIQKEDTATETVRLVRHLADITVSNGTGDDADADRAALGALLGLGTFQCYASFFEADERQRWLWHDVQLAMSRARTKEEFEAACNLAEDKARGLATTRNRRKHTTVHHTTSQQLGSRDTHGHPTPPDRRTTGRSLRDRLRGYADMSYEQRRALRGTPLPPTPEGSCTFCGMRGHPEESCERKEDLKRVLRSRSSQYPN